MAVLRTDTAAAPAYIKDTVWPLVHVPEFPTFRNPNPENEDVLIT